MLKHFNYLFLALLFVEVFKSARFFCQAIECCFFSVIVLSRIIYALPAWGGFLSNDLIAKLNAFFKKAFRWGYSGDLRRLFFLLHEADEHLFHKMVSNKDHCIHQLLPPKKILPMKLRATNCIFALPQWHYNLYKRSFVLRYLFGDAY